MYRLRTCILILIATVPLTGFSQSISVTKINPESPARLDFGDRVLISFEYDTGDLEGVRILVRPISDGEPTPNYSSGALPVYREKGTGSAGFTIEEGKATVDQLRFRVISMNLDRRIFEFSVPVEFIFSSSTLQTPLIPQPPPRIRRNPTNFHLPEKDTTDIPKQAKIPDSLEIKKRVVEADGTIRIYYKGGYKRVIEPSDDEYFITPEGEKIQVLIAMVDVPEVSPPDFISSNSKPNQKWLKSLNKWLKHHNKQLLQRIDAMVGKESLQNYKRLERKKGLTIYKEVDLKHRYLKKLISSSIQRSP